jgi:hypothetical protein
MGAIKKIKSLKAKKEDVNVTTSNLNGISWLLESFLRRFRTAGFLFFLSPLIVICVLCLGAAAAPGLFVFDTVREMSMSWPLFLRYFAMGVGFALGYLTYGLSLIFIVPFVNFLNPLKVKPMRGPWFSLHTVPWFFHNGLTYMVRFTFLEFVTPSPLNILFFRMMGMKIGKGVVINTSNISDPALIEIGDYVTVGGSATIFAHYGQKGYLIVAPVKIGKGTNIGLKASIMGGCTVGENVMIKPHAVLLPKTELKDNEVI